MHHASSFSFFFNDPATTEIYTLSLHDALPIFLKFGGHLRQSRRANVRWKGLRGESRCQSPQPKRTRSEEHTSELQSPYDLVCRLLLEKKKKETNNPLTQQCARLTLLHDATRIS